MTNYDAIQRIFAIDPGTDKSGFVIMNASTFEVLGAGKVDDEIVSSMLRTAPVDAVVIERMASYGMPVGKETFETCEWIGAFAQIARDREDREITVDYIYRRDEKMHICGTTKANDASIRRALIARFATHDKKNGKGTATDPDHFYLVRGDAWSAFAVGLTWMETAKSGEKIDGDAA